MSPASSLSFAIEFTHLLLLLVHSGWVKTAMQRREEFIYLFNLMLRNAEKLNVRKLYD